MNIPKIFVYCTVMIDICWHSMFDTRAHMFPTWFCNRIENGTYEPEYRLVLHFSERNLLPEGKNSYKYFRLWLLFDIISFALLRIRFLHSTSRSCLLPMILLALFTTLCIFLKSSFLHAPNQMTQLNRKMLSTIDL